MAGEIEYIRRHYHVPARVGGRILWRGLPGTITGANQAAHLIVRPDERKHKGYRWILHPTYEVEYL